jgi:hypothetical protein
MHCEHLKLQRISRGIVKLLKYEVFDMLGSTLLQLASSGTWRLYNSKTGALVTNGTLVPDNADTDRAGNTIRTIVMQVDLSGTDLSGISLGPYYLVTTVVLTTGQTDKFRIPVEVIDFEEAGVA